jgi:hypothetical protein
MGGAQTLAVVPQVDSLADLATDPDILGRQFRGLAMWI